MVALYFWILEFDDVTCIRSIVSFAAVCWDVTQPRSHQKTVTAAKETTSYTNPVLKLTKGEKLFVAGYFFDIEDYFECLENKNTNKKTKSRCEIVE